MFPPRLESDMSFPNIDLLRPHGFPTQTRFYSLGFPSSELADSNGQEFKTLFP